MPPKLDINKAGWEQSEFPSVCESCLGPNPYLRMIKENYGAECKICTRPFTVFKWLPDRESRSRRTQICMTCSRLKNCCQHCLLDLQYGLPVQVRDAALKLVPQGPNSTLNREYFAQNSEGKFSGGETPVEFGASDAAARALLQRLAKSEPYYRRDRPYPCSSYAAGWCPNGDSCRHSHNLEDFTDEMREQRVRFDAGIYDDFANDPARKRRKKDAQNPTSDSRQSGFRSGPVIPIPAGNIDLTPPRDPKIASLFIIGVEDDLPEHKIRSFFEPHGKIRSVVCVHKARCAFVNFSTRQGAETAALACGNGEIVIGSNPLRIAWGKPKSLGMNAEGQAKAVIDAKRAMAAASRAEARQSRASAGRASYARDRTRKDDGQAEDLTLVPPPGAAPSTYESQTVGYEE